VIFAGLPCRQGMRKILTTTGVALALAVPALAQADDTTTTTTTTAKATAEKLCRAERGTTDATKAAFAAKYGTNKNKKNAFGKCVSKTTATQKQQDDTAAEDASEVSAAKTCSTERGTTAETLAAFTQKYGTNKNKSNAFGKCVSKTAAAQQDTTGDDDQADDHGNGNGNGRS
jgi:hypothetical protein